MSTTTRPGYYAVFFPDPDGIKLEVLPRPTRLQPIATEWDPAGRVPTDVLSRSARAVLLPAAVALALGSSAAPADAALGLMSARLTVTDLPSESYGYKVTVSGKLGTSTSAEARRLAATGHGFLLRLWGDDPFYDDLIHGPIRVSARVVAHELHFTWTREFTRYNSLNEDPAPLDGDELYVGVRFVDRGGYTRKSVESNRTRSFYGVP